MKQIIKSPRYLILIAIILIPTLLYGLGTIGHIGSAEDILEKAGNGKKGVPESLRDAF